MTELPLLGKELGTTSIVGGARSGRSAPSLDWPSRGFPQFIQAAFLEGGDAVFDGSSFVFKGLLPGREEENELGDSEGFGPEFEVGGDAENFAPDSIE